ncbi:hypothetical protein DSO57_1030470 [Entomophthora muscae]|uniref:Uncharacterized protein n=1 Tax=Entomophthora muscae TaxID=34485 RepID=A0ACC2RRU7_9FUNG|nr:hypothetical protein DSO57_1030470 [Entomophthora muscae]
MASCPCKNTPGHLCRILIQEGPEDLEDAYDLILAQNQDCVEDELDETSAKRLSGVLSSGRSLS